MALWGSSEADSRAGRGRAAIGGADRSAVGDFANQLPRLPGGPICGNLTMRLVQERAPMAVMREPMSATRSSGLRPFWTCEGGMNDFSGKSTNLARRLQEPQRASRAICDDSSGSSETGSGCVDARLLRPGDTSRMQIFPRRIWPPTNLWRAKSWKRELRGSAYSHFHYFTDESGGLRAGNTPCSSCLQGYPATDHRRISGGLRVESTNLWGTEELETRTERNRQ